MYTEKTAAELIALLPDDPFCAPPERVICEMRGRREEVEPLAIETLLKGTAGQRVPTRGYQAVYLFSLLGEWRSPAAIPALLLHLTTPWGYGWDEIVHAATRIGGPALRPMLYASFDRTRSAIARRRAMRAMAGIAAAAREYGRDLAWIGDGDAQYVEITAALRLLLRRADSEPQEILDEAAARLCDLRCTDAWPEVTAAFADGIIKERDGFTMPVASDLMHGRLVPFELGTWKQSMIAWMTKTRWEETPATEKTEA